MMPNSSLTPRTEFQYDLDGRLIEVKSPEGTIQYAYDIATGRHLRTWTGHSDVRYDYDELGRLKTVKVVMRNGEPVMEETTYGYTAVGSRERVTLPNGVESTYRYDSLNRLTNLTHVLGGTNLLASYSYQLHSTGRRTNALEILRTEDTSIPWITNTLHWAYDGMYRLTNEVALCSVAGGSYTNSFVYDKVGNRLEKKLVANSGTTIVSYTYDDNDQLTSETSSGSGTTTYGYDRNGSLIAKTNSTETILYGYNLANKLSEVTKLGSQATNYFVYNDQGIRVRSIGSAPGSTTLHLIDANNHTGYAQVFEEFAGTAGTLVRSYVVGDDVLAQGASYLLHDGHGSTRQVADASGAVTSRYNYDAHGETRAATSTTAAETALLYCGEQYDTALGMYNLRARYYNPATGRFNQRDAYEGSNFDPQSLHKYLYCHADPVNMTDPSGHFTYSEVLTVAGIGAGLGALTTVASTYAYQGRAATMGEIFQGAALGAGFAVGAWAAPVFGVGLAAYGVGTTAINGYSVLTDPNVSWQRKSTAVALFLASAYGTKQATDYAKVMRGYVPSNPNGASLIPQSYMNRIGAIDMRSAPGGSPKNAAGFPRNAPWFFRQLLQEHPEWFSAANKTRIQSGRSPRLDEIWTSQFPEHSSYLGSTLEHHHILQGPVAVPVPKPVHTGWSQMLHPGVPNTTGAPGTAGGTAGGLFEETLSEDDE